MTRSLLILQFGIIAAALLVCFTHGRPVVAGPSLTGDANCDGHVNSIDAMLVLKSAAGLPTALSCPDNADIDFHPGLSSQDALFILQYHAALLVALPPDALRSLPAATCLPDPPVTDGFIMATDILKEGSSELKISRRTRDALSAEIDGVLALVRTGRPNLESIHARAHTTSLVEVNLEPELMNRLVDLWNEGEVSGSFVTGAPDFDLLNAVVGLCDIYPLRSIDWVFLYLDSTVNGWVAANLYESAAGVLDSFSGSFKLDNPVVEAVKQSDTWFVVFRDAWGDCPSGCLKEELFFYAVTDGEVTEVHRADAFADPAFQQVLARLPHRNRKP